MTTTEQAASPYQIMASEGLGHWLQSQQISLAFSTYQAGKLFFVGAHPNGQLSLYERDYDRCMGIGRGP